MGWGTWQLAHPEACAASGGELDLNHEGTKITKDAQRIIDLRERFDGRREATHATKTG